MNEKEMREADVPRPDTAEELSAYIESLVGQGPFMLIDANDMLYPQYSIEGKVREALNEWQPWAKEQAEKLLAENHEHASAKVVAHWRQLAGKK